MKSIGLFNSLYAGADEIKFNPEWKNGTGYFDNITRADLVSRSRFIDDRNRRVVVIPTVDEIVVMNERFTDGENEIIVVCVYQL